MKKVLALILAFLTVISLFTACNGNTDTSTEPDITTLEPEESEKEQKLFVPEGFEVEKREIMFKYTPVLLVKVKNATDKNSTVRVTVIQKNGNGVAYKTDIQLLTGLVPGYENYFYFESPFPYDNYVCEVYAEEYKGECLTSKINMEFIKLHDTKHWFGNDKKGNAIWGKNLNSTWALQSSASEDLYLNATLLLFDNEGELYRVDNYNGKVRAKSDGNIDRLVYTDPSRELVWPDRLKGEGVTGIVCIKEVTRSQ